MDDSSSLPSAREHPYLAFSNASLLNATLDKQRRRTPCTVYNQVKIDGVIYRADPPEEQRVHL
jgi:hypothetical protein